MTYTGGCACGAVRYEIAADPVLSWKCQCRDCQRASGTGHGSGVGFPKAAVRMTGTLKFYEVRAASGNIAGRGFCPICGAWVASTTSGFPDLAIVTAGSLDEPGKFAPQLVCWASSGHAWDDVAQGLPKYEKMPPA